MSAFDDNICANLAQGEDGAIEAIFAEYYPRLVFFSISMIHNREEALDIAQESLMQLWHNRIKVETWNEKHLTAYLFIMAKNKCYDYLRHCQVRAARQKEVEQTMQEQQSADLNMICSENLARVRREINRLPTRVAEILLLTFIEGRTTKEISEQLNISSNLVRVHRSRGLEKLRGSIVLSLMALFIISM